MTDNEIIKALECCTIPRANCPDCPARIGCNDCVDILREETLALIKSQKAEIERLERHTKMHDEIQAEAIKEFAERLKEFQKPVCFDEAFIAVDVEDIDNLVKEMTEGKQ